MKYALSSKSKTDSPPHWVESKYANTSISKIVLFPSEYY